MSDSSNAATRDNVQSATRQTGLWRNLFPPPPYPTLYEVNTRVLLHQRSGALGRDATLDDVEDAMLDRIASQGFNWVWFLGVWQTGAAGRRLSMSRPEWRAEFEHFLPGLQDSDICGSCFAITGYTTNAALGGDNALQRLRDRLAARGMRLMLDFVPNHMATDHPWVRTNPDLFVRGTEDDIARAPGNYCRIDSERGPMIFAYGRDPYFPGWPDTLQLDYANPATQRTMRQELLRIAERCDGVRCDMAMLLLPEVFQRTWGRTPEPFWPETIKQVRQLNPGFCFMGEVYWDREWTLQQQGFDFTYDKRLYDRLAARTAGPVRGHLQADLDYQRRLARFLENHDEPRAAEAFPDEIHQAAAILTFLTPGLRFFHQGQFEGRTKRIPVHLCNAPPEPVNPVLRDFYDRLLAVLHLPVLRDGEWRLLESSEAWAGNGTAAELIAFSWQKAGGQRLLAAVNFAGNRGQCHVRLPWDDLAGKPVLLADRMGPARYERQGDDLLGRGLFLDLPAWGYNVFEVMAAP